MDMLDTHRPNWPDHYGEGLLTLKVSRPFVLGEGINCEGFGKSCDFISSSSCYFFVFG